MKDIIHVRVDQDLKRYLEEIASRSGVSISEAARRTLLFAKWAEEHIEFTKAGQ